MKVGSITISPQCIVEKVWPPTIDIDRSFVDTPPLGTAVRVGRHGIINIEVRNGWAQYVRIEETATGWKYRLGANTYKDPVS
jgi:hypothetical protein